MRVVTVISAIVLVAFPSSAFAQGGQKKYKQTCAEYCAKYCPTAAERRNFCMGNCPSRCEMIRSEKR